MSMVDVGSRYRVRLNMFICLVRASKDNGHVKGIELRLDMLDEGVVSFLIHEQISRFTVISRSGDSIIDRDVLFKQQSTVGLWASHDNYM